MRRNNVFDGHALAKRLGLEPDAFEGIAPAVIGALQLRLNKYDKTGVTYALVPQGEVDPLQVDSGIWQDAYTQGARTQIERAERTGIFDDLSPTVLELAMSRTHDDLVAIGSFYVHIYNGTEFDR